MGDIETAGGDFAIGKPEFHEQVDYNEIDRIIRHLPAVEAYCDEKAEELLSEVGHHDFEVVKAGGPQRYRAYVKPVGHDGIEAELVDSVLLKAAVRMEGK
jgi:hypothetical protein